MNLDTIILSDPLVLGLENRAFREGLLSRDDFTLIEHTRPKPMAPSLAELQAMDIICLYGSVFSEVKRFRLDGLNRLAGEQVLQARPDMVRNLSLSYDNVWRPRKQVDAEFLAEHARYQAIREQAAAEAKLLLRRDIGWYIEDARNCFETEAPRWREVRLYDRALPHASVAAFLRRNINWLVEEFDAWFRGGSYNHDLDADWLTSPLSDELYEQFNFFSRSTRFDAYFRHLQESYASLYENGFIGRATGIEMAYERAPDRLLTGADGPDVAALSRVIRINLSDVADYFPLPRTVEEAFEMRGDPHLKAFRQVLDAWLGSVGTDAQLEARLRHELAIAGRDLRLMRRWRRLKDHPLFFGVKAAASWVPVLDKVINVVDVVDYFAEWYGRRRTAWVVTPTSQLQ